MVIQPILFPCKNLINETELFFRGEDFQSISDNAVTIPEGKELSLETYFNAFSVGKWLEYTNLDNLSLHLTIQGEIEINVYHAVGTINPEFIDKRQEFRTKDEFIELINSKGYYADRNTVGYKLEREDKDYVIRFSNLFRDGIVYVSIKAMEKCTFFGGYYFTDLEETSLNPVKLAVGICTFKREEAVLGNVNRILSDIINNPDSPLGDNLEVYIADNGQTIDVNQFNTKKVHIFPNPNLGGAGGFTRTMIEAMLYDKAKAFTHIIFMDDDILLYPPVLERAYYLLRILKRKYQKAIIGASMFLKEMPYLQQNCGSLSKNRLVTPSVANHHFFDMRRQDAVAANEVINPINYTGWFFTCIPSSIINENNLPMPLFIHNDDVEYGMRNNTGGLILLNGLVIWHPVITNKGALWIMYYERRNRFVVLFVNSVIKKDLKKHLAALTKYCILKLIRYEYQSAEITIKAMDDFLKGSNYLINLNALQKHSELLRNKNSLFTLEEAGFSEEDIPKKKLSSYKKAVFLQMIGNLLPVNNIVKIVNIHFFDIPYRAKKIYIYNPEAKVGYLHERNIKKFFALLYKFYRLKREIIKKHSILVKDWTKGQKILTSLSFWEKYLGLEHKD
ncbi:MAG: glycosyltransferase [Spirochaetia bacterium]|nr:glycosyltransferase [Spirochaetia bacterium]